MRSSTASRAYLPTVPSWKDLSGGLGNTPTTPTPGSAQSKGTLTAATTQKTGRPTPVFTPKVQPTTATGSKGASQASSTNDVHPIDTLIEAGEFDFAAVLKKETTNVAAAAAAYRTRRGRHPPPGFDAWFKFAQDNDAIIVEDFFDQVHHDLNPFWGLPPKTIRKEAWDFEMTINIRNGKATAGSDWFWTQIWLNMTQTIQHLLPDMDIALNAMDEPRIVVPWEDIEKYMKAEKKARTILDPAKVKGKFNSLPPPSRVGLETVTRDKEWEGTSKYTRFN